RSPPSFPSFSSCGEFKGIVQRADRRPRIGLPDQAGNGILRVRHLQDGDLPTVEGARDLVEEARYVPHIQGNQRDQFAVRILLERQPQFVEQGGGRGRL